MRILHPVSSERVEHGAHQLRRRILENYFTLTPHAAERMAQRGIKLKEAVDAIKHGNIASPTLSEKKDGYFCVTFYHGKSGEELIVPVRSLFGDYSAKPVIITAYRNSVEDYVLDGDIDDIVEHVVVEKLVVKAPDDMTDEELEATLVRRRQEKFKKARQEAEAKTQKLMSQKAKLLAARIAVDQELVGVEAELKKWQGGFEPCTEAAS
jgi:hypothetical protein